jgi:hypothetical protein
MDQRKSYKEVKLAAIKPGEIKHVVLPDWFIERVKVFKATLAGVEPSALEETLRSFQRDTNRERELEIWERIAETYRVYISEDRIREFETAPRREKFL